MNLKNHYKKVSKFNRRTLLRLKRIVLLRVIVTYGFKFLLILGILFLVVAGINKLDESIVGCWLKENTGNIEKLNCWDKDNRNTKQSPQVPKTDDINI